MTRKRTINALKCCFIVEVQDTHIYNKEEGLRAIQEKDNIGGVYYKVERVDNDTFKITSRIQSRLKYTLLDWSFLYSGIERTYGKITSATILGRYTRYRKDSWIEFDITKDGNDLIARNEWERGLYRW